MTYTPDEFRSGDLQDAFAVLGQIMVATPEQIEQLGWHRRACKKHWISEDPVRDAVLLMENTGRGQSYAAARVTAARLTRRLFDLQVPDADLWDAQAAAEDAIGAYVAQSALPAWTFADLTAAWRAVFTR